jgi:hypothetical protein
MLSDSHKDEICMYLNITCFACVYRVFIILSKNYFKQFWFTLFLPGLHTPAGGGFHTPNLDGSKGAVAPTPIRDKLSINPEDGLDVGDTPQAMRNYQRQVNMIHLPDRPHSTTVPITEGNSDMYSFH